MSRRWAIPKFTYDIVLLVSASTSVFACTSLAGLSETPPPPGTKIVSQDGGPSESPPSDVEAGVGVGEVDASSGSLEPSMRPCGSRRA